MHRVTTWLAAHDIDRYAQRTRYSYTYTHTWTIVHHQFSFFTVIIKTITFVNTTYLLPPPPTPLTLLTLLRVAWQRLQRPREERYGDSQPS